MTAELIVLDAEAWRVWLGEHHQSSDGVWLVLAKKNVITPTSLTYDQALEEALCHGWIDGRRRSRDEQTFIQHYTPRRSRSMWSQRNVDLVARMETEGRMLPPGRAEVDRAKADGRWAKAYGGSSRLEIPADLTEALAQVLQDCRAAAVRLEDLATQARDLGSFDGSRHARSVRAAGVTNP